MTLNFSLMQCVLTANIPARQGDHLAAPPSAKRRGTRGGVAIGGDLGGVVVC